MSGHSFEETAKAGYEAASGRAAGVRGHHTPAMIEYLRKTRPWVLFLAILALVAAVLSLLATVLFLFSTGLGAWSGAQGLAGIGGVVVIVFGVLVYGLTAVINALFAVLLLRYSAAIGQVLTNERAEDIERALDAQRVFFRVLGIATIAGIALSFLSVFAMVVVGFAMAASGMS